MKRNSSAALRPVYSLFLFALASLIIFSCESSRVGPELPRPNPPAPEAQPIVLSAFVRDVSNLSGISGATVRIARADNTLLTTILTDNTGKYSYDVTNLTENTFLVNANKDGYGFSSKTGELQKSINVALVDDILLSKLQVATASVTVASGGTVSAPNPQAVSSTPLTVTVPANAVSSNITLTAAPIPSAQVPQSTTATSTIQSAAVFGPTGTVFAVPVTVSFPLPVQSAAGSTFNLLKLNPTTNTWTSTGGIATVGASGISATTQLSSFSTYGLEAPKPVVTVPTTGTTTTALIETVTRSSGSSSKNYTKTNAITITVTGSVTQDYVKDLVISGAGSLNLGTFTQNLTFAVPALPSNYLNGGVQFNPSAPNEAGNWVHDWKVERSTTTKNWTASGGVAPNNWTGNGSITEQRLIVTGAWRWVAHNQGGIVGG